MKKYACIYHFPCADGFAAAWCFRRAMGANDVSYHQGVYGVEPPYEELAGKHVVIVDFAYPADQLRALGNVAQSVLVLDHHKTAKEWLVDFPEAPSNGWIPSDGVYVRFDMERSGAGLTWDHFFNMPRPALIDHIEDRDLWRFKLAGTREIQAAVFSYPYDFKTWDDLIEHRNVMQLFEEGTTLERKHMKDVRELLGVGTHEMTLAGYTVPVVNVPYTLASDACHALAEDAPFAVSYMDAADERRFSLRSRPDGVDVSEIASQYGGGGHKHAAGFSMPHGWLGD